MLKTMDEQANPTSYPSETVLKRWMQIKRLDPGGLSRLQTYEKTWELKNRNHPKDQRTTWDENWESRGMNLLAQMNIELGAFWPGKASEDWKRGEIERYKVYIYKIWRKVWDEYDKGKKALIETLHEIDMKIYHSAYVFPPSTVTETKSTDGQLDRLKRGMEGKVPSHGYERIDKLAADAYVADPDERGEDAP